MGVEKERIIEGSRNQITRGRIERFYISLYARMVALEIMAQDYDKRLLEKVTKKRKSRKKSKA